LTFRTGACRSDAIAPGASLYLTFYRPALAEPREPD
jgi:hypothetical protein